MILIRFQSKMSNGAESLIQTPAILNTDFYGKSSFGKAWYIRHSKVSDRGSLLCGTFVSTYPDNRSALKRFNLQLASLKAP